VRLKELQLDNNIGINGTIPDAWRALRPEEFSIHTASLSGTLPSWLGEWAPTLKELDLKRNALSGALPTSMAQLRKVEVIELQQNDLGSGDGSNDLDALINAASDLGKLKELDLSFNARLGGTLPPMLQQQLPSLRQLFLEFANFSGPLTALDGIELDDIFVNNNHFWGALPELSVDGKCRLYSSSPDFADANCFACGDAVALAAVDRRCMAESSFELCSTEHARTCVAAAAATVVSGECHYLDSGDWRRPSYYSCGGGGGDDNDAVSVCDHDHRHRHTTIAAADRRRRRHWRRAQQRRGD